MPSWDRRWLGRSAGTFETPPGSTLSGGIFLFFRSPARQRRSKGFQRAKPFGGVRGGAPPFLRLPARWTSERPPPAQREGRSEKRGFQDEDLDFRGGSIWGAPRICGGGVGEWDEGYPPLMVKSYPEFVANDLTSCIQIVISCPGNDKYCARRKDMGNVRRKPGYSSIFRADRPCKISSILRNLKNGLIIRTIYILEAFA